jgi:hypothetical protein
MEGETVGKDEGQGRVIDGVCDQSILHAWL